MRFKNLNGETIDNTVDYIKNWVGTNPDDYEIYVGCDSQVYHRYIVYVTVIVIYHIGKGAHILYRKEKIDYRKNKQDKNIEGGILYSRLWHEVQNATDVAVYMREHLKKDVIVHLDLNPDKNYKSFQLVASAVGYVTALDFACEIKPKAWAATYAANEICRN